MRLTTILLGAALVTMPSLAMAQQPQPNKEPILLQLLDDVSRARQNAEVEIASCKVQIKDLQQQLQSATEKKDVKEKK